MKRRQPASRVLLKAEAGWELLNRLNMSQGELARRARISPGYLSQLLSGQLASPAGTAFAGSAGRRCGCYRTPRASSAIATMAP